MISLLAIACGGEADKTSDTPAYEYFPQSVESVGLRMTSEIRLYVGDSLWEYIDGGAELYHSFGFVDVATADYEAGETEIVLDLYRFGNSEGAYGLYAGLRPDMPDIVPYGLEGYITGSSLEFVKGVFMVRMIAYDESDATVAAMKALAAYMSDVLPGTTDRPAMFDLFPVENAVNGSDRIVGEGFLGQASFQMVYTRDYDFGEETVTLFLSQDQDGAQFASYFSQTPEKERSAFGCDAFPFDENYCVVSNVGYYGEVLSGLINGKLAGTVNYSDQQKEFVIAWLNSLAADKAAGP
jgi:hypothetical protein